MLDLVYILKQPFLCWLSKVNLSLSSKCSRCDLRNLQAICIS